LGRGFGFGFGFGFGAAVVTVVVGWGSVVVVTVGEPTADARAEALAIAEVLPAGVVFPPPEEIPMMIRAAKPIMAAPAFCSFFNGGPPDGPPLSA
jgi:hypothetical protein